MNKHTAVLILVAIVVVGFLYWRKMQMQAPTQATPNLGGL